MEDWRKCANWLVRCRVITTESRVLQPGSSAYDLAALLHDGVVLCYLLNALFPGAIQAHEWSQRPTGSQFSIMRNITKFLQTCQKVFNLKGSDLFEVLDLYDMRDFGKVLVTLSKLSRTPLATRTGIEPFKVAETESEYSNLGDQVGKIHEASEDDYSLIREQDDQIYHSVVHRPSVASVNRSKSAIEPKSKREYCIKEIIDTEKNYVDLLGMLNEKFVNPLRPFLPAEVRHHIFFKIPELYEMHKRMHDQMLQSASSLLGLPPRATTMRQTMLGQTGPSLRIHEVFIENKMSLVVYGEYCINLIGAQKAVDDMLADDRYKSYILRSEQSANDGKFHLRELLSVPMQRILKYALLLKELYKQSVSLNKKASESQAAGAAPASNIVSDAELEGIQMALHDMEDLAAYINEMKRDIETREIITNSIHPNITDLEMPDPTMTLLDYGRLRKDGELKVSKHGEGRPAPRYLFLFDKVLLVTKAKALDKIFGTQNFAYKEGILLENYQVEDLAAQQTQAGKKTVDKLSLILSPTDKSQAITLQAKTEDEKKMWFDNIKLAIENNSPPGAHARGYDFLMHTFTKPTLCFVCNKLLRGIFYQGYIDKNTELAAHKECLPNTPELPPAQLRHQDSGRSLFAQPYLPPARPGSRESVASTMYGGQSQQTAFLAAQFGFVTSQPGTLIVRAIASYSRSPQPPEGLPPTQIAVGDFVEVRPSSALVSSPSRAGWLEGRRMQHVGLPQTTPFGWFPAYCVNLHQDNGSQDAQSTSGSSENNVTGSYDEGGGGPVLGHGLVSLPAEQRSDSQTGLDQISHLTQSISLNSLNSPTGPYAEYPWYVGEMLRDVAQRVLENLPNGTFLVREGSANRRGDLAISLKYQDHVKHIKIQRDPVRGFVYLSDLQTFNSIPEMIANYMKNSLSACFTDLETCLQHPYRDIVRSQQAVKEVPQAVPVPNVQLQVAPGQRATTAPSPSPLAASQLTASSAAASPDASLSSVAPSPTPPASTSNSILIPTPGGPPKPYNIVSWAIAAYDFDATSEQQLPLHKGERVAVISKSAAGQGWWKGAVPSQNATAPGAPLNAPRVGYFPVTYVLELEQVASAFEAAS